MKENIKKVLQILHTIFKITYKVLFIIGSIILNVFTVLFTIIATCFNIFAFILSIILPIDDPDQKNSSFDKEADSWGLTKSERKKAKSEMMSPEEFIIAEENNDDLLDGDEPEW